MALKAQIYSRASWHNQPRSAIFFANPLPDQRWSSIFFGASYGRAHPCCSRALWAVLPGRRLHPKLRAAVQTTLRKLAPPNFQALPPSISRQRHILLCSCVQNSSPILSEFILFVSNTLVRSSQSSSGPAGGAFDGYGLGRGAAGPDRRQPGYFEPSFRTDPSVCTIMLSHQYR